MAAAIFGSETEKTVELRDTVVVAYQELDHRAHSGVEALRRRGMQLAVDLLADSGMSADDPYFYHFWPTVERATDGWTIDPAKLVDVAVAAPASEAWLIAVAERIDLSRLDNSAERACWELLNRLAGRDFRWSAEPARALDQASPEQLTWMLPDVAVPQVVDTAALADHLARSNPHVVRRSSIHEDPPDLPPWARAMWSILHGASDGRLFDYRLRIGDTDWPLSGVRGVETMACHRNLRGMPVQAHAGWHDWQRVALLCADAPHGVDANRFTDVIDAFEGQAWPTVLPWPFVEFRLAGADAPRRLDFTPWLDAENRWMEQGVALADVVAYVESGALTERIRHVGFPFATLHWCLPGSPRSHNATLRTILDTLNRARPDQLRRRDTIAGTLLLPMCDHALSHGG